MKRSLLNQTESTMVEIFLFGSNGLNEEDNAVIIQSTMKYIIGMDRYSSIVMNPLSKSLFLLKSVTDSGWLYFIFFSYLVVQNFSLYITGVSQKRPPKISEHISQYPNDLCKIFFTSFNLCSFMSPPKRNRKVYINSVISNESNKYPEFLFLKVEIKHIKMKIRY